MVERQPIHHMGSHWLDPMLGYVATTKPYWTYWLSIHINTFLNAIRFRSQPSLLILLLGCRVQTQGNRQAWCTQEPKCSPKGAILLSKAGDVEFGVDLSSAASTENSNKHKNTAMTRKWHVHFSPTISQKGLGPMFILYWPEHVPLFCWQLTEGSLVIDWQVPPHMSLYTNTFFDNLRKHDQVRAVDPWVTTLHRVHRPPLKEYTNLSMHLASKKAVSWQAKVWLLRFPELI